MSKHGFRGDIEGMRAVAVVLVLLFHAGLGAVSGGFVGVDVFFVISGFLITGLLFAELERTGRISLPAFYARRAKRLLPAAGVVLIGSLLLTYLFLPRTRWMDIGWDVVAGAGYGMNWRLAAQSTDYLIADRPPSILQHFWSLAVEEQFYLIWPLLLILVGIWVARRRGGHLRRTLAICLGVVAAGSFAWSVLLTRTDAGPAFFVTTTRIWELALGGGLALGSRHLARLTRRCAAVLGWAGLAAIGLAALLFDETSPFPGYLALLPTLGAAAVIAAGSLPDGAGPARLLGLRPVRAVGAISYSLYLWHWPLLVAAEARFGELSAGAGLMVAFGSAVPAVLTYRYVENPLRRAKLFTWHPVRALQLGMISTVAVVVAGTLFALAVGPPASGTAPGTARGPGVSGADPASTRPVGAAVLGAEPRDDPAGAPVDRVDAIYPDPMDARKDLPEAYDDDCIVGSADSEVHTCVYGDRAADFTVALVGDSHAAQWLPAVQLIAQVYQWRVVTYLKQSCPLVNVPVARAGAAYPSCTDWNQRAIARLTGAERPDLLLTSSSNYLPIRNGRRLDGDAGRSALADGFRRTWSALAGADVPTVVLRGTPQPGIDIVDCVSQHRAELSRCAVARDTALTRYRRDPGTGGDRAARGSPDRPERGGLPDRPMLRGDRRPARLSGHQPPDRELRPQPGT